MCTYHSKVLRQYLTIVNSTNITVNQHIRIILVGSCDTEVWSNDAANSALHHRNITFENILKPKTVALVYKKCIISIYF